MKLVKKLLTGLACCTIAFTGARGINAFAYLSAGSSTIDNDTTDPKYSNSGNFNLFYPSSCYGDSARIQSSPLSGTYYQWNLYTPETTREFYPQNMCDYRLTIFLNFSNFTDYVTYTSDIVNGGTFTATYNIDQSIAPNGWSTYTKNVISAASYAGGLNPNYVKIRPSGYWNNSPQGDEPVIKYAGADAVIVRYVYDNIMP